MSRTVVGYEGEGRHRRPLFVDEGPATAAASSPFAMHGRLSALGIPETAGQIEGGGLGRIERRQISEDERASRQADAPRYLTEHSLATRPAGLQAAAQMQASRMRGAARHVEVVAAARARPTPEPDPSPPEEPAMAIEPVIQRSPETQALLDLAAASSRAEAAWEAFHAADVARTRADEEYELARRQLDRAITTVRETIAFDDQSPAPIAASPELPPDIPANIPDQPVAATTPAAGGGPGLPRGQREVLDAVMRHNGDRRKAAEELKRTVNTVEQQLAYIARKGLLPPELIAKLPARFAKYTPAAG